MSSICPICFETFNGKIKASPDVCNHIFCLQCLQTWTKTDNVCPIDRKKFRKIINLESATTIQIKPRKRRRMRVFYDISTYCEVCKDSSNGDTLLLCDCCDLGYHCICLSPPLTVIPNDIWHCPECVAVELRLRTNKATNADKRYAKNKRNQKKGKVSKSRDKVFTRKLRIHYSETRHIQARQHPVSASPRNISNCLMMDSTLEVRNDSLSEQFESSHPQYDDQPGPSCSSTSAREDTSYSLEDDFEIGDSDFADSSSDYSELDDDISRVIDYFHQQEELNNTATFGEEGHLAFLDEDEFQDYDFDVFSSSENENLEAMTFNQQEGSKTFDNKLFPSVFSEPCTTATSTCENKPFDMEGNDTFDFGDSDFNSSSSENCENKVGDTKVPRGNSTKYKFAEDGCYLASPETSQTGIHGEKQPEDYLHAKHNSTVNHLTPKIDFIKSFKKTTELTRTIDGCNISSSAKSQTERDVIKIKESLLAKQNNPSVQDFNSSSPKKDFLNSLKEARETKRTKEGCNISSSENSQNGIHGVIESEESLHAKQNNRTLNYFNSSSPKRDFMNSLSKARDLNKTIDGCNISSSENSENRIDGVIESEESLHAEQNNPIINHLNSSFPKRNLKKTRDLKKIIDGNISCSENSQNGIDSVIVSEESLHAKQKNQTVTDFYSSSTKRDFMNCLNKARDLNKTIDGCNISSSETCESKVSDTKVPRRNSTKYKFAEDGCYLAPSETSQNGIHGMKQPEDYLHAKHNSTVNHFNSLTPKIDLMKSLKKTTNVTGTIDGCNISSSAKSQTEKDVIKIKESLLAKQNNPYVHDFNSSSPKKDFLSSLKEARETKRTKEGCNISSSENSQNGIPGVIESEESLQAKQNNPIINYLNSSSPKRNFMKTLKKTRDLKKIIDGNISCSENSQNGIDSVIESKESLHGKQNNRIVNDFYSSSPKQDFMKSLNKARDLNKTIDRHNISSSENSRNGIDGAIESEENLHAKQNNRTVNDFCSSSPKRDFMNSLKKARNLKRTLDGMIESDESLHAKHSNPNIKHFSSSSSKKEIVKSFLKARSKFKASFTNFKDTSYKKRGENSTNEAVITYNQQVKRKTFDNVEPDLLLNTCSIATSNFENDASDFNISPLEICGTEMDDGKTCKENLHLNEKNEDIDNCNTSSSKNNESTDDCSSFNTASSKGNESVSSSKHTRDYWNSSNSSSSIESETMDDYISTKNLQPNKHNETIDNCNGSSSKNNEATDECYSSNILSSEDNESIYNCNFLDASCSKRTIDDCNSSNTSPPKKKKRIDDYISTENLHLNECNNAIDNCNISSSENCQNKMDGLKSKKRLHAKEQNQIQNDFDSSSSASNKNSSLDKFKDGLCPNLRDNDDNSTSSMDCSFSDYHKAILLKLPLRLSFKRTPKTSDDQGLTNNTSSSNATIDDISASICKIASVASLQQLDIETASCSDDSLPSNTATIRTDQVLQTQNSTNKNKQNEIDGCSDMTPSISIPIIFSLVEEQNAFEPFKTKDTDFFNCAEGGSFIENPLSNFYSSMARDTTTPGESLKQPNEEHVKTPIEISPTKKFTKNDYTLSMEKSGNLTLPSNVSHLFGNRIFIKDVKQLSVRKDGALFLNWKKFNS